MRPIATDALAEQICSQVARHMRNVATSAGIAVPVQMLSSFGQLAAAVSLPSLASSAGVYIRSERKIYLNQPALLSYSSKAQAAILAHELGHAHSDYIGALPAIYGSQTTANSAEEFYAERMACVWGFFDGVREMRIQSGAHAEYLSALTEWPDEGLYLQRMGRYFLRKASGIVT